MTYKLHEKLHDHVDAMTSHRFMMLLAALIYFPSIAFAVGWYLIVDAMTPLVIAAALIGGATACGFLLELCCYLWHRSKANHIENHLIEIRKHY